MISSRECPVGLNYTTDTGKDSPAISMPSSEALTKPGSATPAPGPGGSRTEGWVGGPLGGQLAEPVRALNDSGLSRAGECLPAEVG